jgi:hypothetical protein
MTPGCDSVTEPRAPGIVKKIRDCLKRRTDAVASSMPQAGAAGCPSDFFTIPSASGHAQIIRTLCLIVPLLLAITLPAAAQEQDQQAHPPTVVPQVPLDSSLLEVKRIFVAQLTGGIQADALRDLIIASLNQANIGGSKLFILTENEERADATLKGAADDHTFEDTFDSQDSLSFHGNASSYGGNSTSSSASRSSRSGGALGSGISENDSEHIKERKHEAYAAVRLCNRDGDVIWSTTKESLGAKFRGASADVAAKVARQLVEDVERARRPPLPPQPMPNVSPPLGAGAK